MKRNKLYNNESKYHKIAKEKVFDWITNYQVPLIDQFNEGIRHWYQFAAIECPVEETEGCSIPFHNAGSCLWCFPKDNMEDEEIERKYWSKLNYENYLIKSIPDSYFGGVYKLHPCNGCVFNNNYYNLYFDMAFGRKGYYTHAIEIVHTSKIKNNKILFCEKNDIDLYEIKAIDVFAYNGVPEYIPCVRLV